MEGVRLNRKLEKNVQTTRKKKKNKTRKTLRWYTERDVITREASRSLIVTNADYFFKSKHMFRVVIRRDHSVGCRD